MQETLGYFTRGVDAKIWDTEFPVTLGNTTSVLGHSFFPSSGEGREGLACDPKVCTAFNYKRYTFCRSYDNNILLIKYYNSQHYYVLISVTLSSIYPVSPPIAGVYM